MDINDIVVSCHFVSNGSWEHTAMYKMPGFKPATVSIKASSDQITSEQSYDLKQNLLGHVIDNGLERDAWMESNPVIGQDFEVF